MIESHTTGYRPFAPEELQERCLQNLALAQRVLQAFLESGVDEIAAMEEAANDGRIDELARRAHRLKGASDNVAAHRLRGLAAKLEQDARHGVTNLSAHVAAIRAEWDEFQGPAEEFLAPCPLDFSATTPRG